MVRSALLVEDGILWFAISGGSFRAGTMCGCCGGVTGWGERQGWRARWWRQCRVLAVQDRGKKGRLFGRFWTVRIVEEFGRCCWVGIYGES